MSKGCNLFSFQKLNKYFWLPFLIPIVCFTTKFFSEEMKTNGGEIDIEDVTNDNTHTFAFLYQIIQAICLILGGLFYFFFAQKSKSRKESLDNDFISADSFSSENSLVKNYIKKNNSKKKKVDYKKSLIIAFMPLLLIIYNLGIAYGVGHPQLEKRVYFLLFITLINLFVFKKQLYKHHALALVIALIGLIPIYLSFFSFLDDSYYILYDILLLIGSFCYSIYLVLIKYLTLNKQMFVLLLLLYQGIFSFIYTLLIFMIFSYIQNNDLRYIMNIFNYSDINYLYIPNNLFRVIMYLILNTFLQTLIFVVVYIFSPELFAISDIFSPLFSFIAICIKENQANKGKEKSPEQIFLTVLGYLIMAVGAFIYNELIVCNFCGFNENTWKAIDKKANDDIKGRIGRDSNTYLGDYKVQHLGSLNDDNDCLEMKNKN